MIQATVNKSINLVVEPSIFFIFLKIILNDFYLLKILIWSDKIQLLIYKILTIHVFFNSFMPVTVQRIHILDPAHNYLSTQ